MSGSQADPREKFSHTTVPLIHPTLKTSFLADLTPSFEDPGLVHLKSFEMIGHKFLVDAQFEWMRGLLICEKKFLSPLPAALTRPWIGKRASSRACNVRVICASLHGQKSLELAVASGSVIVVLSCNHDIR